MVMPDVIEAILFRCEVNDLIRSKSVCKSWYSLISSPAFAKTQAKFISIKEEDNTRRIDMINPWVSTSLGCSSLPVEWQEYRMWSIAGSSNGLVGLFSGPRICVTNPLTRVFRELAQPPKLPTDISFNLCLGFGYDSCGDDYKVFMAIFNGTDRALVHVLSLKSNIWKHLGQVNYRFHDGAVAKRGILFNGALHWFWFDAIDTTANKVLLVSFDLAKEKFREIPQPDDSRYVWSCYSTLGIIKGRLCIFHKRREDGLPYSIWVMKNYNSWQLLPNNCEIKDHAIHYMLKDDGIQSSVLPTYYCDDNMRPSRDAKYISSPIFVQTLVSPYLNKNGRPRRKKNNKSTVNNGRPSHTKNNHSTLSNGRQDLTESILDNTASPSYTMNKQSTLSNGRPDLTENNDSNVNNARRPSHTKNNQSTLSNGRPDLAENNESTVDNIASSSHTMNNQCTFSNGRRDLTDNNKSSVPSHPKNNQSTVKAASSVKEKREMEEEERVW